jgi:hypothetical protein
VPAQTFDLVNDLQQEPPKRDAIEQGADYAWGIQFRAVDIDGTASGDWAARMQIRRAVADRDTGDPLVDLDSGTLGGLGIEIQSDPDGDLLVITVNIDDTVTGLLPTGRFYYDVELIRLVDNYVRRLVQGRVQVVPEVTR